MLRISQTHKAWVIVHPVKTERGGEVSIVMVVSGKIMLELQPNYCEDVIVAAECQSTTKLMFTKVKIAGRYQRLAAELCA